MGEGARLAAATGAWTCFEEESGQALQPPKARTRGRRGRTPVVKVSGRGSGRISVADLACLKPGQPGRFYYRMHGHRLRPGTRRAMTEADYVSLITAVHHSPANPQLTALRPGEPRVGDKSQVMDDNRLCGGRISLGMACSTSSSRIARAAKPSQATLCGADCGR